MSQQEFADNISCSRQRVSRVERGLAEYTASQAQTIAVLSGIPLERLLNTGLEMPPWAAAYVQLDKARRRQMDGFILAALKLLEKPV